MIKINTGRKSFGLFLYPLEKYIYAFWTKLGRTNVFNDCQYLFLGNAFTVGALAYKCVISIGNSNDACPERNVVAFKSFWISFAVKSFMMTQYCWNYGFKGCYRV